jgi:hypothetical protein
MLQCNATQHNEITAMKSDVRNWHVNTMGYTNQFVIPMAAQRVDEI